MNLERYTSYYDKIGKKYVVLNGNIFCEYNKMIIPIGSICKNYCEGIDYKNLFKNFPTAIMVRSTSGLKDNCNENWYSVICDKFKDLDEMNSKLRYQVKKGLNNCKVKKITPKYLADNGYRVFINAFNNYKGTNIPKVTKQDYYNDILSAEGYEDIIDYWGVFHDDILVAYSVNYKYGKDEVNYSTIKIDPKYLNKYPAYALIHEMNKYYLKENNFKFVNDGFRSISHESNIQEFLIKKFNFRKQEVTLNITYRWYLELFIKLTFLFKNSLSKIDKRIAAIYNLEDINRKNKRRC